ncbi:hypothetical protein BX265_3761 [Streptomyces sp. TLI_235]|nr:hypothetical protein BX265_3761 [Streptomyces sp. TLI_235]
MVRGLGGGVGDLVEPGRVVEVVAPLELGDDREDELLLQADPAEVAAVAHAVPGADEGEGLGAVEGVRARLQPQAAVAVLDGPAAAPPCGGRAEIDMIFVREDRIAGPYGARRSTHLPTAMACRPVPTTGCWSVR